MIFLLHIGGYDGATSWGRMEEGGLKHLIVTVHTEQ